MDPVVEEEEPALEDLTVAVSAGVMTTAAAAAEAAADDDGDMWGAGADIGFLTAPRALVLPVAFLMT